MTRTRLDVRQQLAVLRHPRHDRIADAHQFGGLAEQAGQPEHVLDVQLQHCRTLCVQGGGDGAGIHVGIAVHVTAHPRTEPQQARQRQRAPPGIEQRLFQRFVEHRDHPVQHAGEIETHMLAFVIDGGTHRRGIGGLPRRGQRHAETRGIGGLLTRRALAVEVVDQRGHHQLFFFQQRATHGFGRMRGEHRFDVDARQPLCEFFQRYALRLEREQGIVQTIGLRAFGACTLIVATATNAVHALGDVHHLEIGAECTHQRLGFTR
ncbi:hypothetical protein D3C71_1292210 [compost metagenome]